MATTTSLDALGASKYLSLTTFKKDGTAVATPVWLVRDGDRLRVITNAESGKAKRIRNNPNVLVAPCDSRGRLRGDQVPAIAEIQSGQEAKATQELIRRRYGLLGNVLMWRHERASRKAGTTTSAGIWISLT